MLHELQRFGLVLIEHRYRPNGSSMTNRYSLMEAREGVASRCPGALPLLFLERTYLRGPASGADAFP